MVDMMRGAPAFYKPYSHLFGEPDEIMKSRNMGNIKDQKMGGKETSELDKGLITDEVSRCAETGKHTAQVPRQIHKVNQTNIA